MAFRNPATSGYRGRAPGPPRSARRFQQPVCQCRRCSTPSPWPVHAGQTTRCAVPGPISCWQPGHRYVFRAAGPGTVRTRKSPSAVERAVCQPAAGCAESSSHRSVATRRWARSGRWERRGTAERYPCVRVPGTMATSRTTTSTGREAGAMQRRIGMTLTAAALSITVGVLVGAVITIGSNARNESVPDRAARSAHLSPSEALP